MLHGGVDTILGVEGTGQLGSLLAHRRGIGSSERLDETVVEQAARKVRVLAQERQGSNTVPVTLWYF